MSAKKKRKSVLRASKKKRREAKKKRARARKNKFFEKMNLLSIGQWCLVLFVAMMVCIVVGLLVNFVFNAISPKTCSECDKRKRDQTMQQATQNASAEIDDGGDDI